MPHCNYCCDEHPGPCPHLAKHRKEHEPAALASSELPPLEKDVVGIDGAPLSEIQSAYHAGKTVWQLQADGSWLTVCKDGPGSTMVPDVLNCLMFALSSPCGCPPVQSNPTIDEDMARMVTNCCHFLLDGMRPEERVEWWHGFFNSYCEHCGHEHQGSKCQCENDE